LTGQIEQPDSDRARQSRTQPALGGPAVTTATDQGSAADAGWLVRRAAAGDKCAWERLVDQYSRLIWAMTRDFRLADADAADVVQATWLRLLEHIDRIEYPERIGSWLATTARHECLRHLAASKRLMLVDDDNAAFGSTAAHEPEIDEGLLAEERARAVRAAMAMLPTRSQQLLQLLMADPPVSYTEISDQLGLPIGSIGPTRGRCLERLRLILQLALARRMCRRNRTHRGRRTTGGLNRDTEHPVPVRRWTHDAAISGVSLNKGYKSHVRVDIVDDHYSPRGHCPSGLLHFEYRVLGGMQAVVDEHPYLADVGDQGGQPLLARSLDVRPARQACVSDDHARFPMQPFIERKRQVDAPEMS
jgi:RNA polymerase sigma factor (sigma-70 family)